MIIEIIHFHQILIHRMPNLKLMTQINKKHDFRNKTGNKKKSKINYHTHTHTHHQNLKFITTKKNVKFNSGQLLQSPGLPIYTHTQTVHHFMMGLFHQN